MIATRKIPTPPFNKLQALYVTRKLTTKEVAGKLHVSYSTAQRWLKGLGLVRSISEANSLRYENKNAHEQTSNNMLKWWANRTPTVARNSACYVCGRSIKNRTFCSRFCAHSPKGRRIIAERVKATIKSLPAEILAERIRKSARKPNEYGKILDAILQEIFPNEWKYVGDGQLIINGKNPDWVNINGKKQLIELWGGILA